MKLNLIFFFLFIRGIFFPVVEIKTFTYPLKKKNQQNTAKNKLPWNMSIKKIKCNLYAVRLLSPIEPVLNVVLSVICKDDKTSLICNNKKGRNFLHFIMC